MLWRGHLHRGSSTIVGVNGRNHLYLIFFWWDHLHIIFGFLPDTEPVDEEEDHQQEEQEEQGEDDAQQAAAVIGGFCR